MRKELFIFLVSVFWFGEVAAQATELKLPQQVTAGTEVVINTMGTGDGTLYVMGPGQTSKRQVRLGKSVTLKPEETYKAGRYTVVLQSSEGKTAGSFYVVAASPSAVSFLAQPSRVPAARPEAISGTAFVFDKYSNLVTAPTPVKFELSVEGMPPTSRTVTSKDGVSWTRMDSGRNAGAARFVASTGQISVLRVVQQVASEPCNLQIRARREGHSIIVETEPIRDCAGNPVPDGTIVTFTQVDSSGTTTVDARIKRGMARAELPGADRATISAASGVVVGNEIRWGSAR